MTDTDVNQTARPSDLVRDDLPHVDLDPVTAAPTEDADLYEALKDVVDPELGINVVDLGLIYGLHLEPDRSVTIDMTLTSAACPLTDVIQDQTNTALQGLVPSFAINWVWMPPGPGDDHRRRTRTAAGARLQRVAAAVGPRRTFEQLLGCGTSPGQRSFASRQLVGRWIPPGAHPQEAIGGAFPPSCTDFRYDDTCAGSAAPGGLDPTVSGLHVPTATRSATGDLAAWSLLLPADAAFTHLTAARQYGWWLPEQVPQPTFVAAREGVTIPVRQDLLISRHPRPVPISMVGGLRLTTPAETLLAAARDLRPLDW